MLYFIPLRLLRNYQSVFLNPFTFVTQSPRLPPLWPYSKMDQDPCLLMYMFCISRGDTDEDYDGRPCL